MRAYAAIAATSAKEALVLNGIGVLIAFILLLFLGVSLRDSFGFIILLESTGVMLVGGALGLAGQATTRKITEIFLRRKVIDDSDVEKGNLRATLYLITGGLLFAEGYALAMLLA